MYNRQSLYWSGVYRVPIHQTVAGGVQEYNSEYPNNNIRCLRKSVVIRVLSIVLLRTTRVHGRVHRSAREVNGLRTESKKWLLFANKRLEHAPAPCQALRITIRSLVALTTLSQAVIFRCDFHLSPLSTQPSIVFSRTCPADSPRVRVWK